MDIKYNLPWGTFNVATSATGASFVQLPSVFADEVQILPAAGVGIDISSGNPPTPSFASLPAGIAVTLKIAGNTNGVWVRRTDQSNTPGNVGCIWKQRAPHQP